MVRLSIRVGDGRFRVWYEGGVYGELMVVAVLVSDGGG